MGGGSRESSVVFHLGLGGIPGWISFAWWTVFRYHWMVRRGSRPSSRRVTIRLTRLTPMRCWPRTTPCRASWGTRRRSMLDRCGPPGHAPVTSTGSTGSSMTSRVRCTHPPFQVGPAVGTALQGHAPPARWAPCAYGRSHGAWVFVAPLSPVIAGRRAAYYLASPPTHAGSDRPPRARSAFPDRH